MSAQNPMFPANAPGCYLPPEVAIRVRIRAQKPARRHQGYGFSLWVEVHNQSPNSVRLLSRCWQYCDAQHHVTEMNGPCVVGQQPEILPGARYTFPASVTLLTSWGSLEGRLRFLDDASTLFEVAFPRVMLAPAAEPATQATPV